MSILLGRSPRRWILTLAFLALIGAGSVLAQSAGPRPLSTDRPGAGVGSAVLPVGGLQVEMGYSYTNEDASKLHSLGQVVLRYGLSSRVELRTALNSFLIRTLDGVPAFPGLSNRTEGFENFGIGAKVALAESDGAPLGTPGVGIVFGTTLPTGAEDLAADSWEPAARLAVDWNLAAGLILSVNLGLAAADTGNGHAATPFNTAQLTQGIGSRTSVWVGHAGSFHPGRQNQHLLEGGVTWLAERLVQLDLGIGAGLTHASPDFVFGAGLTVRF